MHAALLLQDRCGRHPRVNQRLKRLKSPIDHRCSGCEMSTSATALLHVQTHSAHNLENSLHLACFCGIEFSAHDVVARKYSLGGACNTPHTRPPSSQTVEEGNGQKESGAGSAQRTMKSKEKTQDILRSALRMAFNYQRVGM